MYTRRVSQPQLPPRNSSPGWAKCSSSSKPERAFYGTDEVVLKRKGGKGNCQMRLRPVSPLGGKDPASLSRPPEPGRCCCLDAVCGAISPLFPIMFPGGPSAWGGAPSWVACPFHGPPALLPCQAAVLGPLGRGTALQYPWLVSQILPHSPRCP